MSKEEISLLSKGLKFIPTPKHINKARIKEELETYGRKLRLMWHYRNQEREIIINPFKKKSKFNPKRKDAAIKIYLSPLEEEIFALDKKLSYSNLTKQERHALYSLRDDTSIIIKEADKGSGIVVWDREDYLAEARTQLKDKDVYQELKGNIVGPLEKIIKSVLRKVRDRKDISDETLDYFLVNNPKLGRFYLLPKIHKRLYNVPGRPVISNSGYYTENISAFLEYHLKPISQKVKSYIKDNNDFLRKLDALPSLPEDTILCTIDVVGLYPNIPHEDGLVAMRKALDEREDKTVSTDSLIDLTECVLKNNIFEHNTSFYKQLRGTAIGTKMAWLEAWLRERGYSDKLVRQQILKARTHKRKDLLNNMKDKRNDYQLVFNITYHPNFSKLKDTMSFLHLLLTPDQEHQKVFHKVPIIGFRRAKSLKDILVRAKVPPLQKNEGFCGPCKKPRCEICKHMVNTNSFKSTTTQRTYFIRRGNLKCSSENVVYLFTCKTCSKQYTGSTEDFRPRFNNYRCAHRNFLKRQKVKQESFNAHFAEVNHNGEDDWEVRLIDQTDNVEELRKRESFWQHELDTFQPNGLNEREVALF